MNKKLIAFVLAAFLAGAGASALLLMGRRLSVGNAPGDSSQPPAHRYHCPMHPTIVSDKPGNCPICNMELVPDEPRDHGSPLTPAPIVEGRALVEIPFDRQQLIGVRTAVVEKRPLAKKIRTVGRVTYDEKRLHHVHTKVGGWIERLYANATGELVKQGQPLMTIYSPELLASQQEFLLALRARDRLAATTRGREIAGAGDLVESARRRLRLFDLSDQQIADLERTGEASRTITIFSPVTGHIIARNVAQGEKIDPGTTVLDIADLSRVWVLADIYEYELPFVKQGMKASLTLSYLPGRAFDGQVGLVLPFLSEATRTVKVRLEFANPDLTLKPEMFGEIELKADLGESLVLPESAVISTGDSDIAFVDLGEGRFEPRALKIGVRLDDGVEVLEGLTAGERVVVSGNFLIDSESKLRAARGAAAGGAHVH